MVVRKDIEWLKKEMGTIFDGYELKYKFFEEGDFGSLNQVEFNSKKIGGNIDLWELGWVGFFVWDYEKEEQLLNVLLEPQEKEKIESTFEKIKNLLKN